MRTKRRNPLDKEHFLEGTRQKWMVIFLLCAGGVMYATARHDIDPRPFMEFLTMGIVVFVVGAATTSSIAGWQRGNIEREHVRAANNESTEEGGERL